MKFWPDYFWHIQVEKATAILTQMKESQSDNSKLKALFEEFYTALPHRPQYRTTSFSISWLARKLDLCQVWIYVTQVCHYVKHYTMSLCQAYHYLSYASNATMSVIPLWQLCHYTYVSNISISGMQLCHFVRYVKYALSLVLLIPLCQIYQYELMSSILLPSI